MSTADDCCKVRRVGDQYDVDVDSRLVQKHQTEGASLRKLEEYLGGVLLRRVMEQAGMDYVEGDPKRYYRLLVDNEASRLEAGQIRRRLAAAGVDVDRVLADVPSYQSIRSHLADCLDKDTSRNKGTAPSPSRIEENIRALQTRTERVISGSLARLRSDDRESPDTLTVHVDITVMCECGRSMGVFALLRDGCECRT